MSRYSPAMVVGDALLDVLFAQALLQDPRLALAQADIQLDPDALAPFLAGAQSIAELARLVFEWEVATGRAERPLWVPALERRRQRVPAPVDVLPTALAA